MGLSDSSQYNHTNIFVILFLRLMVSASQDGKLIVWDTYTTNKVRNKRIGVNVNCVSKIRDEKVGALHVVINISFLSISFLSISYQ